MRTGYDSATGQSMDIPSGQTVCIVFSTSLTTSTSVALISMPRSGNLEDASLPGGLRSGGEGGTSDTCSRGLRI